MRLRTKFLVIYLIIGLVGGIYLDQGWVPSVASENKGDELQAVNSRLAILGDSLVNAIKAGDSEEIQRRLEMALAMRQDWVSISLKDHEGNILFDQLNPWVINKPKASKSSSQNTPQTEKNNEQSTSGSTQPDGEFVVIAMEHPVIFQNKQLGLIELRLKSEPIVVAKYRRWEFLILAIYLALLSLFWFFFEHFINRPLLRLVRATWALASGDYKVKLPKPRNDEMGSLVTSFRMMREAIQKRESEMMATTERMQSIFDRAVDGIFLTDHTGLIETLNPSAQRMLGCDKGQGEGENIDTFVPGIRQRLERGDFHMREDIEADDGAHPVMAIDGKRRDGTPFSLELGVSRLMHGNKVKYLGMFRDVTKRMEMEQQLAEYTSELEAKNVLLDHALEDIRAASRAKTEFLANLSDEFRTPMNGVLGMLTLLQQDENLTEKQTELLSAAISSGNALMAVMNDILDFSKIETGKLDFENIEFDLRRVIEELCRVYERVVIDKPVSISSMISASVPSVIVGDPTRFRQILNNLLSNAVKYTDKGEIVVRADKVAEDGDDMIFELQVSDTGCGVSQEVQEKIVKTFTQSDDNAEQQYKGTGLGLSICKRLVSMFGGELGLDSEKGKGSTFWFTIRSRKPVSHQPAFVPIQEIKGIRVLCVDDNPTSLEILERILEMKGILCTTVLNGEDGLKELRQAVVQGIPFDLAIIDRMMPGMDGIELAKIIREDSVICDIKMVLLTSVSVRGDGQLARDAGFNGYFTKPITQSQIYDCIATVMGIRDESKDFLVTRHTLQEHDYQARRILLVEDNLINQKVALGLIAKLGYHADLATNGQEAVNAATSKDYDAILMDCEMPVMSGYEATRLIREYEKENETSRVPIIALTAHAATGYQEKCREVGMDDHLAKPVRLETLKVTLHQWIATADADNGIELY